MTEENLDTTNEEDDDLIAGEAEQEQTEAKKKTKKVLTPAELERKEFDKHLKVIFKNEGALADVEGDAGGLTKYGITQSTLGRWLGTDASDDEVKGLTLKTAGDIYLKWYWTTPRANQLPAGLRLTYFDMCVNHGQGNAVRILQKAINLRARGGIPRIDEDGLIGKNTIRSAENLEPDALRSQRILFLANLVIKKPDQKKFWYGWYLRAIST